MNFGFLYNYTLFPLWQFFLKKFQTYNFLQRTERIDYLMLLFISCYCDTSARNICSRYQFEPPILNIWITFPPRQVILQSCIPVFLYSQYCSSSLTTTYRPGVSLLVARARFMIFSTGMFHISLSNRIF